MLALVRDVSGRRESEVKIRYSETRYRTLVEQIPAVTYVQEPIESENPKAITYMSPQYEAMLGYPANAEIVDEEHWLKTLHPEDRERGLAEEIRTDETGEPYKIEYRLITRDGSVVWVRDEAELVRDGGGRTTVLARGPVRHHRAETHRGRVKEERGAFQGHLRAGHRRHLAGRARRGAAQV